MTFNRFWLIEKKYFKADLTLSKHQNKNPQTSIDNNWGFLIKFTMGLWHICNHIGNGYAVMAYINKLSAMILK